MEKSIESIEEQYSQFQKYFLEVRAQGSGKPLSLDQMAKRARQLASDHQVTFADTHELLLDKLGENENILHEVHDNLVSAIQNGESVSPAAEWILDNFYLIDEQIQLSKKYLPKGYSRGLPKLLTPDGIGRPRVLELINHIIAYSDAHTDAHSLNNFILAYQEERELTLGELWAIPIMLRFALIDNLKNVALRIVVDRRYRDLGIYWAERILAATEADASEVVQVLAKMAKADVVLHSSFVTEFHKKIHAGTANNGLPLAFLEQKLAPLNLTINLLIHEYGQQLAQDQVSAANSINSLRFLAKLDWREFVENVSLVERTLREDSNGVYAGMDFQTRDFYRHQIEEIAKQSDLSENEIARVAIDLSKDAGRYEKVDRRYSHVGFFLTGKGRKVLEAYVGIKRPLGDRLINGIRKNWNIVYVVLYLVITVATSFLWIVSVGLMNEDILNLILVVLSIAASTQIAAVLTNWLSTVIVKPSTLPKMDFAKGIPDEVKTMVVVPTLVSSMAQVNKLTEDLEVRYLGNPDTSLLFALLTDFEDSDIELTNADHELLNYLAEKIKSLNVKYGGTSGDQFFLFHRPRLWNESEKKWMGYERKRGKLGDLNHLLKGNGAGKFMTVVGSSARYADTKYVITLDTDTQLPRDAARKMIGIMEHPLNTPVVDEARNIITDGYGIIQPRVAISLHGSSRSIYSFLNENDVGIDPYTGLVSDVYQDVFKEGSFIGKGIYNVDVFEKCLNDRFPENTILSHDLLEGSYLRCGYASDVQLYEENPSAYIADVSRRHRWIRGDWQILSWLFPSVRSKAKKRAANPISFLSKWKIFDNLRRSVVPVVHLFLLITGLIYAADPAVFMLVFLAVVLFPAVVSLMWSAVNKESEIKFTIYAKSILRDFGKSVATTLLAIIFIPYEAAVNTDAIVRALWRMYVSKKYRLQWMPSAFMKTSRNDLASIYKQMVISPVVAVALLSTLALMRNEAVVASLPLVVCWIAAPWIARRISFPSDTRREHITKVELRYLRKLARKTWAFYDQTLTDGDNWLPPDNLQQYPIPVVAHRTSPTNIGITLLANLAGYDFGYIPATAVIERTRRTFDTLNKLDRYKGHLFNWYDTQSLHVLSPRYISTVDSGNFAGHLLTLRQGLQELKIQPLLSSGLREGIDDAFSIVEELSAEQVKPEVEAIGKYLDELKYFTFTSITSWKNFVFYLRIQLDVIQTKIGDSPDPEFIEWVHALDKQVRLIESEVLWLQNWEQLTEAFGAVNDLSIPEIPSLQDMQDFSRKMLGQINPNAHELRQDVEALLTAIEISASDRIGEIDYLMEQCSRFADIDFDFLYDKSHKLLTIGYNLDSHQRDSSYYDLLASEARLSVFIGIAQGKIPQESWFALGRRLTSADGMATLMSWSGSMFEYLMPLLIMPSYENTLLHETHKGNVRSQIDYGNKLGIPWGVSESCYNVVDSHLIYQYKAFGVPEMGFKRGLEKDQVIAPYATVMALMVEPRKSFDNLMRMKNLGYEGKYGFFEAVEYTPSRLPRSKQPVVIQTFMAHHQGMGFLALDYLLNMRPMQRRFEADPQMQTALLLLQERLPKAIGMVAKSDDIDEIIHTSVEGEVRIVTDLETPVPEVHLLSNGRYHVMISQSGGGYSRWKDLAVTRWREDGTRDHWGTFCYITDLDTGDFFSSSYQPTLKKSGNYEAIFSQGRAEFRRTELNLECHVELIVSAEDDVELRRIRITNASDESRSVAITSYAEWVIAPQAADTAHPAFSNLFVQTEILEHSNAIIGTRRARANDENPPWSFYLLKSSYHQKDDTSYETDRMKFIGRANTLAQPQAITSGKRLSGSQGSVLDPIASIQSRFDLGPGERIVIDLLAGMATTRDKVMSLVDKFQDQHLRDRAFDLSWTHSQVALRQIDASESQAQLYSKIASAIIYQNAKARARREVLMKNNIGQSGLWRYSVSGDIPIVLLIVRDVNSISLTTQLIQARAYWQLKGLSVDLVILNEDRSGYRRVLEEQVQNVINALALPTTHGIQGNVFIRSTDNMTSEDIILFQSAARIVFTDDGRSLLEQVQRHSVYVVKEPDLAVNVTVKPTIHHITLPASGLFNNSYGCFSEDGKEYLIKVDPQTITPLPWINVIANKSIGTIVSESGQSYTWFENAQMFRLSPWSNDPVADGSGELFYLRDDDSGDFWSPTPWPKNSGSDYLIRHGFGYTAFEHKHNHVSVTATTFVDTEDPVKFTRLIIKNESSRMRRISWIGYIEWVLGTLRPQNGMHIVTDLSANGGIVARNPYNSDFPGYVGFCKVLGTAYSFTGDRREFLGRNGTSAAPRAMRYKSLSNSVGAAMDPCTAMMAAFELRPGEEIEIVFMIGAERNRAYAEDLLKKYDDISTVVTSYEHSIRFWKVLLGTVQIETPDPALNILTNGWLIYQVLSCRFWGRSGFYQSGGAFGFRDQLQDSIALLHAEPLLTREQILKSSSRQFIEGDVQHWWHPPTNRGVRTLCSDDFLWLPYVTSRYVEATGDYSILQEEVAFIDGRHLNMHEESYYDQPIVSQTKSSLYTHCKIAIERGIKNVGVHGLPLIGSGDWNDGMNMVGIEGKGESIWLGFFLYDVINKFLPIVKQFSDEPAETEFGQQAEALKTNLNKHGWGGKWFLRAYFDNGQALGTPDNDECKIDSIAQSWSLLSGAGDNEKISSALASAYKYLVNQEKSIIQLLDPPFDKSPMNPGYIKGYVPGVRENGGQYTHAAIWLVMAFAQQKDSEKTWSLLQTINPINHGASKEIQDVYKVEPYVLAADVYGVAPHIGRGGWTWYTGSAGWMYQLIVEHLLGIRRVGRRLYITPCIPETWKNFGIKYRYGEMVYDIQVTNAAHGQQAVSVNGVRLADPYFELEPSPIIAGSLSQSVDE
jgi:cyclic beta-1,2-glucan synthetase